MAEFRLEAQEFQSLARWRWMLTGPDGEALADHEVRLDPGDWRFAAFTDLLGYLRWHAAPDRRVDDEARIVTEVGEWIRTQVLGPVAEALDRTRSATVRVVVPDSPPEARALVFRPLELGHVRERPLAVQGPGHTGPVLVLVLPGRSRPDPAGGRGQLGRPIGAARPHW
jgi:hypothetical protein